MRPFSYAFAIVFLVSLPIFAANLNTPSGTVALPALVADASVVRDGQGIAHILAGNEHDAFLVQGYVHAQDRLFQMDVIRRTASGTLAELLGQASLPSDILFRQLGLRRAAVRSLPILSARAQAALQAYADGVNAYVSSNPLPPEYAALELTQFQPWTATDSMSASKFVAFSESFDVLDVELTIGLLSYQLAGAIFRFDGGRLFSDVFRPQPFETAATVPDASTLPSSPQPALALASGSDVRLASTSISSQALSVAVRYLQSVKAIAVLNQLRDLSRRGGSNEWAVSGAHTANGLPLLANDPHLPLLAPSSFYPVELRSDTMDVVGASFVGAPGVATGHNARVSWGATFAPTDVTDYYFEVVLPDLTSPSGLSTVYRGQLEHVIAIPEVYRVNDPADGILDSVKTVSGSGIPKVTLVVPRRNNGPLLVSGAGGGIGLSIQYTGFSGTREPDALLAWDTATDLSGFMSGLHLIGFGSFNIAYSDVDGNIAYFTVGEVPVREDLQAGMINGLPPFMIRNGTGGNEWLPVVNPQPDQVLPYEILPAAEMPHIMNPPAGFFVNANNDPLGLTLDNNPLNTLRPNGGILYLNVGYDLGLRAARITEMLRDSIATSDGTLTTASMQRIQADTKLKDAEFFVPFITQALQNGRRSGANFILAALSADPGVASAVSRLANWDFTTPVGIQEGYDANLDGPAAPPFVAPSQQEIASSVAATIYSVWRAQFIRNTVDMPLNMLALPIPPDQQAMTALRNLLVNFPTQQGFGSSGINFFQVPLVSRAEDRRDILILFSLQSALARLAGPAFFPAFQGSHNQQDYRWGRIHRIVFTHSLGGDFNIPPAMGAFPAPLPGLAGIPTDGGFATVDAATHDVRGDTPDAFMFNGGAANRFVSQATTQGMTAVSSLPGGVSGIIGSPNSVNLLPGWLTNQAFPLLFGFN